MATLVEQCPFQRESTMSNRALLRLAFAAAIALLAAGIAPASESLHLKLDKSLPAADQTLTESPAKIVLDFSQKPELAVSRLTVARGEIRAKLGELSHDAEDDSILYAIVEAELPDGTYRVNWLTSSGDGHPIRGEFSFTVAKAGR